jgi:hypothetical protein
MRADWSDGQRGMEKLKAPSTASAAGAAAPATPEVQGRDPVTEPLAIAGSDLVRGRSTVLVDAPIRAVRTAVLAFDDYASFMPHYLASRVVGRTPDGGREIYMQIEALHGAVKMWAKIAMPKARARVDDEVEIYESRFLEGNVKEFHATWRLEPVGDGRTKLTLDVFLHPDMPIPIDVMNDENLGGAEKGVVAMRQRIEKGAGGKPADPPAETGTTDSAPAP